MYSTWRSVESAGYWDLTLLARELGEFLSVAVMVEDGVPGAWLLPLEAPRWVRGEVKVEMPLRTELIEAVREEGKDDSEAWRVTPLPMELGACVRLLVEGREGIIVAIYRAHDVSELLRRNTLSWTEPLDVESASSTAQRHGGMGFYSLIRWNERLTTPHHSVVTPSP